MKKIEVKLPPIYRVNVSVSKRLGVFRLSFLIGRRLAEPKAIRAAGVLNITMPAKRGEYGGYLHTGYHKEVCAATQRWMMKNNALFQRLKK